MSIKREHGGTVAKKYIGSPYQASSGVRRRTLKPENFTLVLDQSGEIFVLVFPSICSRKTHKPLKNFFCLMVSNVNTIDLEFNSGFSPTCFELCICSGKANKIFFYGNIPKKNKRKAALLGIMYLFQSVIAVFLYVLDYLVFG